MAGIDSIHCIHIPHSNHHQFIYILGPNIALGKQTRECVSRYISVFGQQKQRFSGSTKAMCLAWRLNCPWSLVWVFFISKFTFTPYMYYAAYICACWGSISKKNMKYIIMVCTNYKILVFMNKTSWLEDTLLLWAYISWKLAKYKVFTFPKNPKN